MQLHINVNSNKLRLVKIDLNDPTPGNLLVTAACIHKVDKKSLINRKCIETSHQKSYIEINRHESFVYFANRV